MRSLISRTILASSTALVVGALAAAMWSGCAADSEVTPPSVDSSAPNDTFDDTRIQHIDVRDDAGTSGPLCGDEQLCDPDIAAICTPISPDAAVADTTPIDGAPDGSSAGSTAACRVIKRENRTIAACAPAGKVLESQFCASDDECAPGLACVGALGRCLRYCCKEWAAPAAPSDAGGGTHYCTPRALTARPSEKVPVWVKLDNCTLLDDSLQCLEGTTCTVVTNDGRTTCVQAGTGRDYAPCAEEPCDRGYVCLGTTDRLCRKICRESEGPTACPGGGYCQRVPTIPEGYGICTGGDAGT